MPNSANAKKRGRQNEKCRRRNRSTRSRIRTQVKTVRDRTASFQEGEVTVSEVEEVLRITCKILDQGAARGVIHPNTRFFELNWWKRAGIYLLPLLILFAKFAVAVVAVDIDYQAPPRPAVTPAATAPASATPAAP